MEEVLLCKHGTDLKCRHKTEVGVQSIDFYPSGCTCAFVLSRSAVVLICFQTMFQSNGNSCFSVRVTTAVLNPLIFSADDHFTGPMDTNVVIRHDGQIMWDSPAITKSSCKVDVSFFPFDAQQCKFTYGSWTYNGNQLDIVNALESADLADLMENVEWEILGMPAKKNVIQYGCCADPYPDVTYTLKLKRRASFYVFNLLIPCVMISFLAPLGFYLPADSGEKVSLGVTVMLALTVFQLLVAEIMPPSENVPLIGKAIDTAIFFKSLIFIMYKTLL